MQKATLFSSINFFDDVSFSFVRRKSSPIAHRRHGALHQTSLMQCTMFDAMHHGVYVQWGYLMTTSHKRIFSTLTAGRDIASSDELDQ